MRLRKNTSFYSLLFVLLVSFLTQPLLAASISTSMQIDTQNVLLMSLSETNMTMEQNALCDQEQSTSDCVTHCLYCMAITFILPVQPHGILQTAKPTLLANQSAKPVAVSHMPAFEPPRFSVL